MSRWILGFCFMTVLATSLTGCYRMPSEDDYSLVPSTNNPTVTRQRAESPIPQATY